MAELTISGAGPHSSAAATDRIPASKAGVAGYLTNSQIKDYILGLANTWTGVQTFSSTVQLADSGLRFGGVTSRGVFKTVSNGFHAIAIAIDQDSGNVGVLQAGRVVTGSAGFYGFLDGANLSATYDTALARNASGVLEINNGTNGTFRDLKARKFCTPMTSELTIASGAITITGGYHRVDTEADAASDDLDTINGGADGDILTLRAENDARTVVVKDGTGNIQIAGDMTLDNTQDTITLRYDGTLTAWLEIGRAASGA